jgi:hypothetical protein
MLSVYATARSPAAGVLEAGGRGRSPGPVVDFSHGLRVLVDELPDFLMGCGPVRFGVVARRATPGVHTLAGPQVRPSHTSSIAGHRGRRLR